MSGRAAAWWGALRNDLRSAGWVAANARGVLHCAQVLFDMQVHGGTVIEVPEQQPVIRTLVHLDGDFVTFVDDRLFREGRSRTARRADRATPAGVARTLACARSGFHRPPARMRQTASLGVAAGVVVAGGTGRRDPARGVACAAAVPSVAGRFGRNSVSGAFRCATPAAVGAAPRLATSAAAAGRPGRAGCGRAVHPVLNPSLEQPLLRPAVRLAPHRRAHARLTAAETSDADAPRRARTDPRPEAATSVAPELRPLRGHRRRAGRSRQAVDCQGQVGNRRRRPSVQPACHPPARPHPGLGQQNPNPAGSLRRAARCWEMSRQAPRPSLATDFPRSGWGRPMAPQARTCRRARTRLAE